MNIAFLTDRWGDPIDDSEAYMRQSDAVKAAAPAMIERLVPMMADEVTFVIAMDGEIGLLVEVEFDDGFEPPADRKAWWESQPEEGVRFMAVKGDGERAPAVNDHWAWWAFIPAERCTTELVATIAKRMLDDTLGTIEA